jgi:adenine-specific DNA-methyltransferase
MNYIGSKYSLLEEIESALDIYPIPREGIALDLFAGTGAVSQLLKLHGYITYANDWQRYSYVTNVAFIELNALPDFGTLLADAEWGRCISRLSSGEEIKTYSITTREPLREDIPCAQVLRYLNQLPGRCGPFCEMYCNGGKAGRMYFSRENGLRIQAMRDMIENWSEARLISKKEKAWLLACLIESADRVANTASVYGAYLKHVKRTAQKSLSMVALRPTSSKHPADAHQVFCEDSNELLARFSVGDLNLIYIDPPYNHRQYASNYHILETMARWDMDQFDPRGVTGLRDADEQRSDFCLRSAVEDAFRDLFERIHSEYLLFSYNNEGLLSQDKLLGLFEEFCTDVRFTQIEFRRFRADVDHENRVYKADRIREYLILGKPQR